MIDDYTLYEAAGMFENEVETFLIERGGVNVVLIPRLEASGLTLFCDYEVLDSTLSIDDVKGLVYVVLLGRFLQRYYLRKISYVQFKNLATGEESRNVYVG